MRVTKRETSEFFSRERTACFSVKNCRLQGKTDFAKLLRILRKYCSLKERFLEKGTRFIYNRSFDYRANCDSKLVKLKNRSSIKPRIY